MFAVNWSEAAIADLDDILRYLGEVNPQAALRYAGNLPRLGSQSALPLLLVCLAVPDHLPY